MSEEKYVKMFEEFVNESSKINFKDLSKKLQEEIKDILEDPEYQHDKNLGDDIEENIKIIFNDEKELYKIIKLVNKNIESDLENEENDDINTTDLKKMKKESENILKKLK